jgi:hypothetical protein
MADGRRVLLVLAAGEDPLPEEAFTATLSSAEGDQNTNRFSQRRPMLPEERGGKCPLKLLIHQPMEPELIHSLHQLIRAE